MIAARALAPLALMGLIFFLSAQPNLDTGLGIWDLVLRKIAHLAAFGGLAALWWWTLRPISRHALWLAGAISLLYAGVDEYHQTHVEGRSGTVLDVGVDAVGIALALAAARAGLLDRWATRIASVASDPT